MVTFQVFGNWGTLTCDATSGDVLRYDPSDDASEHDSSLPKEGQRPEGYFDITRLDVAEWLQAYPGEKPDGASHDILDFGTWDKAGVYVGPELDWRRDFARDVASRAAVG